jgi:hypothetical protein
VFALVVGNTAIVSIDFISDKDFDNILGGVGFDLPEPIFHGIERLKIVNGVSHDDTHGALVIGLGDGLEPLLTGSVPDLHAYFFTVNFEGFDFEVDA